LADHANIAELQPNQWIDGLYVVQNCQLGQTRTGKPYLKCLLSDATGRTSGRMWNASQDIFERLPTDGIVWLEGQTQPYQGEMQVIIKHIAEAVAGPEELAVLMPRSPFDADEMFAELTQILAGLQHPPLIALARAYLSDEPLMQKFRAAPAAMALHHAYLHGLLEHTLQLLKIARAILPLYPKVNADVVLMGLFLHDLAKCAELKWDSAFSYSTDGQLVGHIARGILWLEQKSQQCRAEGQPIPEPLLRVLHHIILSHHGKPEYGALKVPATPEAVLIHQIDNIDAKTHMALAATRTGARPGVDDDSQASDFTERLWALETKLYKPDPTTLPDELPEQDSAEDADEPEQ
jgi:3'-5' exoribonuclease